MVRGALSFFQEANEMQTTAAILRKAAKALSYAMCICVTWEYASLFFCGKYGACSAPAWVALLYALPFAAGIAVCLLASERMKRNAEHAQKQGGKPS